MINYNNANWFGVVIDFVALVALANELGVFA